MTKPLRFIMEEIKVGGIKMGLFLGGDQKGNYYASKGCGVAAIADIIAYHIQKDYNAYKDLLKYNNEKKYIQVSGSDGDYQRPNPNYTNFNKTYKYDINNKTFFKSDYIDFMDFYSYLSNKPGYFGMADWDMQKAFGELRDYTGFNFKREGHILNGKQTADEFIELNLKNDIPILMLNDLLTYPDDKRYFINDKAQADTLDIDWDKNFGLHWMTVTKLYKNETKGEAFIAFGTWGRRVSVNADVLTTSTNAGIRVYHSHFSSYEILPK